jgi:glycosyltransferase involved in cell wall biosynthesis
LLITNSFFDRVFSIPMLLMRRVGAIPHRPALLAPRGEFSPGALAIRQGRKNMMILAARGAGLLRGIAMQATSEAEAEDIRRGLGFEGDIFVTPNIRDVPAEPQHCPRSAGEKLRVTFLSRIDRKKNLLFALDALAGARVPIAFNIYGPVSDEAYWRACQARVAELPEQVTVTHHGSIAQREVLGTLAAQDLFFLPTHGENFGHSIADALLAGTPALLSDQTPWRRLADTGAGWDLPLAEPAQFSEKLREMAAKTPEELLAMRRAARAFGVSRIDRAGSAALLKQCLETMITAPAAPLPRLAQA